MQIIKKAWIESDAADSYKLCVRYSPDTGAENFGCFFPEHHIKPEEFEGLNIIEACRKFKDIVYPQRYGRGARYSAYPRPDCWQFWR